MKLVYQPLGQRDARWRYKKVGTGSETFGTVGCAVTIACVDVNRHGHETTPDKLSDDLVTNNGFYQGNLIQWGVIPNIYKDMPLNWEKDFIQCPDKPAPLEEIYRMLKENKMPLCKIDISPVEGLQEHWVAVVGYDDASLVLEGNEIKKIEFIIFDPYYCEEYFFTGKYGDPKKNIWKIVAYGGEIPHEETDKEKILRLEAEVGDWKAKTETAQKLYGEEVKKHAGTQAKLRIQEEDNIKLVENANEERRKRITAEKDLLDWEGEVKGLLRGLISPEELEKPVREALRDYLASQKENYLDNFNPLQLIFYGLTRLFTRRGVKKSED